MARTLTVSRPSGTEAGGTEAGDQPRGHPGCSLLRELAITPGDRGDCRGLARFAWPASRPQKARGRFPAAARAVLVARLRGRAIAALVVSGGPPLFLSHPAYRGMGLRRALEEAARGGPQTNPAAPGPAS